MDHPQIVGDLQGNLPGPRTARLDFEDCDFLLIAMPTEKRAIGAVEAYWLPSGEAAAALKSAHGIWLASSPQTNNRNQTFSIWFDAGLAESGGFRERWAHHRLGPPLRLSASAAQPF